MHQNLSFCGQKYFFLGRGPIHLYHTLPLDAYGASPLLTEILNTPLIRWMWAMVM